MAIYASDSGGSADFEPAPAGNHVARCVSIIDLGTQENEYLGEVTWRHQVFLMFELPSEMKTYKKDDQEITEPFTVSGFYTLSLNEKAKLCHLLEGWRGKSFTEEEKAKFDITVLAGKPCMLNVTRYEKRNGKPGSKITSAAQLPKGMEAPEQVHPTVIFSLEDFDQQVFDNLSDGLKKLVMQSDEYRMMTGQVGQSPQGQKPAEDPTPPATTPPATDDSYDDIPFS